MINGVNLNSESIHKSLLLSASKMTETKATLTQNKKFATFTSMGSELQEGSKCFKQTSNMTLNDLKKGMHAAHIRLQNNGWNYENFCRLYKSTATNTNTNTNNNNNQQQNFNNKNLSKYITQRNSVKVSAQVLEKTNLCIPSKQIENVPKRTQDQENAFRRIEDVHNYAKLNFTYSESGSGESSRSSPHQDDDEDDDEEAAEDSTDTVDLEQKDKKIRTDISLMSHLKYIKKYRLLKRQQQQEEDIHIDVETVPHEEELHNKMKLNNLQKDNEITSLETEMMTPDHHARRPMNAFLIFCKRHRAIVKDRYKTLENRAITKILGDWWASLDANDKECFTNLAQQNKDAFFSANPNFKWYKLPAPPLRTLRGNSSDNMSEYPTSTNDTYNGDDCQNNNYFKLADETQMGDLSTLLTHNEKRKQKHMKNDHAALQQALGETTQFLNKHMQAVKRTFLDSNNGLEMDEILPKKTSRTCKGKKYQELMQSGQIAASAKKSKLTLPKQQQLQQTYDRQQQKQQQQQQQKCENNMELNQAKNDDQQVLDMNNQQQQQQKQQQEQQQSDNSKVFDLEEKINELPALSLDLYLQRKRNVKKKRKINAKKSNSSHLNTTVAAATTTTTTQTSTKTNKILLKNEIIANNNNNNNDNKKNNNIIETQDCGNLVRNVVVGSQKRKARKESITRRDVSSVENEVTAVLPMSSTGYNNMKGNYFFDDTVTSTTYTSVANGIIFNNNEIINNYNKAIPPTSDLLILAEVAEKTSCY